MNRSEINLDITHRCLLQCPKCQRNKFPGLHKRGHELDIDDFQKIVDYFPKIIFCGQMSDPIYHPEFPLFLEMAKHREVSVDTNGHGKHSKFWQRVFTYKNVTWRFGLDGLPEDSHRYRINQDGKYVFEVMKYGKRCKANVQWNYIVFKYNENDIDEARELAKRFDIDFNLIQSSRWEENDEYKPSKYFLESYRDDIS